MIRARLFALLLAGPTYIGKLSRAIDRVTHRKP